MLYLSLILIASGIFFIIYTLLSGAKKGQQISCSKKDTEPAAAPLIDKKPDYTDKCKNGGIYNIAKEEIACRDSFEDNYSEADNIEDESEDEYIAEKIPNIFSAVLYEDASGIIDYDNNDSAIDPTLGRYKKIRRIDAGSMEITGDGINFRAGKKLFRYDFRRIADIKSGDNFIALLMKGSDVSRLFLFKKDAMRGAVLKQVYNNYLRS